MGNIDRHEGSPEDGCSSPNRRAFLAGLAGLAGSVVVNGISGCASSKANAVYSGITIEDEVSCGGKLVGHVSEILGESDYIKTAGDLDEACSCSVDVPPKFDFVDSVEDMIKPYDLALARVADEVEKENDAVLEGARMACLSQESIDESLKRSSYEAQQAYKAQKTEANYKAVARIGIEIGREISNFSGYLEEVKGVMRAYLAVASRYLRLTSDSNDFYGLKQCKLADLHRKVGDSISVYQSLLDAHFLLKNILPPSSFMLEEPPVDLELEIDDE